MEAFTEGDIMDMLFRKLSEGAPQMDKTTAPGDNAGNAIDLTAESEDEIKKEHEDYNDDYDDDDDVYVEADAGISAAIEDLNLQDRRAQLSVEIEYEPNSVDADTDIAPYISQMPSVLIRRNAGHTIEYQFENIAAWISSVKRKRFVPPINLTNEQIHRLWLYAVTHLDLRQLCWWRLRQQYPEVTDHQELFALARQEILKVTALVTDHVGGKPLKRIPLEPVEQLQARIDEASLLGRGARLENLIKKARKRRFVVTENSEGFFKVEVGEEQSLLLGRKKLSKKARRAAANIRLLGAKSPPLFQGESQATGTDAVVLHPSKSVNEELNDTVSFKREASLDLDFVPLQWITSAEAAQALYQSPLNAIQPGPDAIKPLLDVSQPPLDTVQPIPKIQSSLMFQQHPHILALPKSRPTTANGVPPPVLRHSRDIYSLSPPGQAVYLQDNQAEPSTLSSIPNNDQILRTLKRGRSPSDEYQATYIEAPFDAAKYVYPRLNAKRSRQEAAPYTPRPEPAPISAQNQPTNSQFEFSNDPRIQYSAPLKKMLAEINSLHHETRLHETRTAAASGIPASNTIHKEADVEYPFSRKLNLRSRTVNIDPSANTQVAQTRWTQPIQPHRSDPQPNSAPAPTPQIYIPTGPRAMTSQYSHHYPSGIVPGLKPRFAASFHSSKQQKRKERRERQEKTGLRVSGGYVGYIHNERPDLLKSVNESLYNTQSSRGNAKGD